MSSNGSSSTWLSLLEDKKDKIENILRQGYPITSDVISDRSFRTALETLCRKRGEYRPSRLEAKLFPSYRHIIELVKAVGYSAVELQQLAPTKPLERLVWRISFAVIEVNGTVSQCYVADQPLVRVQSWSSAESSCDPDG